MSLQSLLFAVFAIGAIASAIATITRKNPVASAMTLVAHFFMLTGLYLTLEAQFVAAVQVLVYAGAIMVLVLFVLMLLNLKSESGRRIGIIRSALTVGIAVIIFIAISGPILAQFENLPLGTLAQNAARSEGGVKAIGEVLYGRYIVQFELSSLVLLVGVVGAVMLAKRKNVQLLPREGGMGGGK